QRKDELHRRHAGGSGKRPDPFFEFGDSILEHIARRVPGTDVVVAIFKPEFLVAIRSGEINRRTDRAKMFIPAVSRLYEQRIDLAIFQHPFLSFPKKKGIFTR